MKTEAFNTNNTELFCTDCDLHEYKVDGYVSVTRELRTTAESHVEETGHTVRLIFRNNYEWQIKPEGTK